MAEHDDEEKTVFVNSDSFVGKVAAAGEAPPALIVLMGPPGYTGKTFPLIKNEVTLGRNVECDIFVDDQSLSRNHVKFMISDHKVSVFDLGSTNKTHINNQMIVPLNPVELNNNDQIKTGNVVFKFLEKGSIELLSTKEIEERATKDALTGAHTKGDLFSRGPELIKRSETLMEPLSLITFDIDHFKKINDVYGHPGGDFVLKEIGAIVGGKLVRSHDYFVRYGGEEFIIFLVGSNAKTALEVAERIRLTIETHKFIYKGQNIPVTVSLGVSERKKSDKSWNDLYERGDKALYQSKQNGRNQVNFG